MTWAIKLTSTKQAAQLNGLKVCVYGASGAGKTRLCATTGAPTVIISAESGLLSLRDTDIPVIEVQTLQDVFDAYQFVSQSAEAQHFEWVCLDSISDIGEAVLSAEKKTSKDPRQAYGAMADQMHELVRAFRDLPGKNVYFSAKMENRRTSRPAPCSTARACRARNWVRHCPTSLTKCSYCAPRRTQKAIWPDFSRRQAITALQRKIAPARLTCMSQRTCPNSRQDRWHHPAVTTYPPNKEQYHGIHFVQRNSSSTSGLI